MDIESKSVRLYSSSPVFIIKEILGFYPQAFTNIKNIVLQKYKIVSYFFIKYI